MTAARYPKCEKCETPTGHKSGLCPDHRKRKCAQPGCTSPEFIAQNDHRYCNQCSRKASLQTYYHRTCFA